MKNLTALLVGLTIIFLGYGDAEENDAVLYKEKQRPKRQATETLTITTIQEPPFVMNTDSGVEGFCIDLLNELSQTLRFSYLIKSVKDGKYGSRDKNGNWSGMVGEIVRKEADLAVAPLTIISSREKVISFTKPFLQTGISILLRKEVSSGPSTLFGFLSPFSKETWIGLVVAYLITSLCLFLVGRLSPCEWTEVSSEQNQFSFLNSLWFGIGAFTLQGAQPHPKSVSARIIAVIWWVFSITLLAAYIASFAAFLNTVTEQTKNIQTFEDLVKQSQLDFGTINDSYTLQFFKYSENPTYRLIFKQMEKKKDLVLVKTFSEGVRRVQETNYAFLAESVMQDLVVAKHCDLTRAPEIIGSRGYGIAASLDSPHIKPLSIEILKQIESGNVDFLREKWWENQCSEKGSSGWTPIQPQTLGGIFLILGIGLALGIMVSLIELMCKAKNNADLQKTSCCSAFSEELSQRIRARKETQENAEKVKP